MGKSSRVTLGLYTLNLFTLLLQCQQSFTVEPRAYFYAWEGAEGLHFTADITSKCTNIPDQGFKKPLTKSIIAEECVMLYELEDCKGGSVKVAARTDSFVPSSFGNRSRSFQPCRNVDTSAELTVTFFSDVNFKGTQVTITNITKCLPLGMRAEPFDSIYSIDSYGSCVALCGSAGCPTRKIKYQSYDPQLKQLNGLDSAICPCTD